MCENDYMKKTCKFSQSLMIWVCLSGKGTGEMAVITINPHVFIDILDTFLIHSAAEIFIDDNIIFQDDNASCYRGKNA